MGGEVGGMSGRGTPSSDYTGADSGWNDLAERLSDLSRVLQDENDVEGTLQAILKAATDTVPGAEHASISSVVKRREVYTRTASDDLARSADQAQYETGQRPCLILMERYKINAQEAFRLVVSASQTTNIKLREVADYLTRTGELHSPRP